MGTKYNVNIFPPSFKTTIYIYNEYHSNCYIWNDFFYAMNMTQHYFYNIEIKQIVNNRGFYAGLRGQQTGFDASYADRVPIHDQGADLYPTGQSGAVDLLFCAGALFQDQCPYGGGIRSGHYAHYADDDPAFVCLPEQDQEKIQEFLAVSVIFRRAVGDIFPFQSE